MKCECGKHEFKDGDVIVICLNGKIYEKSCYDKTKFDKNDYGYYIRTTYKYYD